MSRFTVTLALVLLLAGPAAAAPPAAVAPGPDARCGECGMFVANFPNFVAEMVFRDGSVVFFDGARDLFRHHLRLAEQDPGRLGELAGVFVTEYYDVQMIDARAAYFVAGSDVFGPMGPELIPFRTEAAAREFMKDHKGREILRFEQVDREALRPR